MTIPTDIWFWTLDADERAAIMKTMENFASLYYPWQEGQREDVPLSTLEIPNFLLKKDAEDNEEENIAERILGRPIYRETRKQDEREIRRAYNRMEE